MGYWTVLVMPFLGFKNKHLYNYMNLCKKLLQCYVWDLIAWKSKEFFHFWFSSNPFLVFIILSFRMRSYNRVCSHTECYMCKIKGLETNIFLDFIYCYLSPAHFHMINIIMQWMILQFVFTSWCYIIVVCTRFLFWGYNYIRKQRLFFFWATPN